MNWHVSEIARPEGKSQRGQRWGKMARQRVEVIELRSDDGQSTEGVAEVDKKVTGLRMSVGRSVGYRLEDH